MIEIAETSLTFCARRVNACFFWMFAARKNGEGSGDKEGERRNAAGTSGEKGCPSLSSVFECGWPFCCELTVFAVFIWIVLVRVDGDLIKYDSCIKLVNLHCYEKLLLFCPFLSYILVRQWMEYVFLLPYSLCIFIDITIGWEHTSSLNHFPSAARIRYAASL